MPDSSRQLTLEPALSSDEILFVSPHFPASINSSSGVNAFTFDNPHPMLYR